MIDPWEVVMIGAIIAALLVWGPKKIPELAKSLGEAKHELQAASRGEYKGQRRNSELATGYEQ